MPPNQAPFPPHPQRGLPITADAVDHRFATAATPGQHRQPKRYRTRSHDTEMDDTAVQTGAASSSSAQQPPRMQEPPRMQAPQLGARHRASTPMAPEPRVQEKQLLQSINHVLQSQYLANDQTAFKSPMDVLKRCDPQLRQLMMRWYKHTKNMVASYTTHSEIAEKYRKCEEKQALFHTLEAEAKKGWQWVDYYKAHAKPIAALPQDKNFIDATAHAMQARGEVVTEDAIAAAFKVDEEYLKIKRRHARELQDYIVAHQKQCLEALRKHIAPDNLKKSMLAHVEIWETKFKDFLPQTALRAGRATAMHFYELTVWHEMPKATSRLEKKKRDEAAREAALRAAHAKYEQMSMKELSALAALEMMEGKVAMPQSCIPEQHDDGPQETKPPDVKKPKPKTQKFKAGGVMEYIFSNKDVRQDFNVEFVDHNNIIKTNKTDTRERSASRRPSQQRRNSAKPKRRWGKRQVSFQKLKPRSTSARNSSRGSAKTPRSKPTSTSRTKPASRSRPRSATSNKSRSSNRSSNRSGTRGRSSSRNNRNTQKPQGHRSRGRSQQRP
eukprot:TRINITY_DN39685_c0_g2_i1.p1 TRINITY_DN39685_c0_g2~~TRINITY_DN39685_c0_g2_i1.p1  ORF type:complete len:554 (+),score=98.56 TRINITY_DN39685_c0_g2_i1:328-1989(+)